MLLNSEKHLLASLEQHTAFLMPMELLLKHHLVISFTQGTLNLTLHQWVNQPT